MSGSEPALTGADVPSVLQCLQGALSQNVAIQKQAEAYLSGLEQRPGFCSCLAEIIAQKEYEHSARWLASVHFKNNIVKHWRGRSMSPDEKAHIRQGLGSLISQEDSQIAIQVALIYAKIARLDFPSQWPNLFQDLLTGLTSQGASTLEIRRVYLILHHVLKELSSKRLAADTRIFAQVTTLIFPHAWTQWCSDTQSLLSGIPAACTPHAQPGSPGVMLPLSSQQPMMLSFERWLLLLKILRRLLLFGVASDAKSMVPVEAVTVCAPPMLDALCQLAGLRPVLITSLNGQAPSSGGVNGAGVGGGSAAELQLKSQMAAMLDRGITKLAKGLTQIQEVHPWSFHASGALLPSLDFFCSQVLYFQEPTSRRTQRKGGGGGGSWTSTSGFERYLIQGMTCLLNVLKCGQYKGKTAAGDAASDHEQDAPLRQLSDAVARDLTSFWTSADRVPQLCASLIHGYLPLTAPDLDAWCSSSEDFYHGSDGSSWTDQLGGAAEVLLLTLLKEYPQVLAPMIVQLLHTTSAACPSTASLDSIPGLRVCGGSFGSVPQALLIKDAAYAAVAVGAYELYDHLDFTTWLRSTLLQELAPSQDPMARILRRRCMKVVSAWVARVETQDRTALYQALYQCLVDQDVCMQLTAVSTFHVLIDDWNFQEEGFAEFAGPVLGCLMHGVLQGTHELDSHTQVFNLINVIIERMGEHVKPHVQQILSLMPTMWGEAEGQSLVRMQILLALQRLVNVLGPESQLSYPVVLPLLQYSLDLAQTEAVQLLEDALGLWLVAIRNAASPQSSLFSPLPMLTQIMAQSTEHIQHCCAILNSLALMGGEELVTQFHGELCTILTGALGNLNERGTLLILGVLDRLLACAPTSGPPGLKPALLKLLAMVVKGKESSLTVASALAPLSRLFLSSQQAFLDVINTAASEGLHTPSKPGWPSSLSPPDLLLAALLEIWCEHMDSISNARPRKLAALALSRALSLPSPVPLAFLDVVMGCVTGVWHELEANVSGTASDPGGSVSGAPSPYALNQDENDGELDLNSASISEDAQGEVDRRAQLRERDPVSHMRISEQLRNALAAAESIHGAPALHHALGQLDAVIGAQVRSACGLPALASPPPPQH